MNALYVPMLSWIPEAGPMILSSHA
jgi:hypothetical protein